MRLLPRHAATRVTLAVVIIHFGFVLWWIFTTFAVIDEVGHLGAGLANWRTLNMRPYCVNPPLPRMIATLPTWAENPSLSLAIDERPGMRSEWALGTSLARDNPDRYISLLRHDRLANLVWAALAIGVLWRWSGELYGLWGRLIVVSVWCLDPTVIAFSGVVVPDVAAAASGLLVCYLFWRYLRSPSWFEAWLAGLALGLALLTKTTWLILFAVWPVLIGMSRWGSRADLAERPRFWHLPFMAFVAWLVLCFGYGFTKVGRPLGDFEFISQALAGPEAHSGNSQAQLKPGNRFRTTAFEKVPVPLPADLIVGIDMQKSDFERKYESYLNGEWRERGWWYYYLYAMAIKLALPTFILMLAGVFCCFISPRAAVRLDEWAFLLPAIAVLAFVSSQTGFNHHMRYVLPAFPLLFMSAGRLAQLAQGRKWLRVVIASSLIWCFTASASVAPYFMSYFNPLAGGPENGWRHLVDSNIDWGQDILHLKKWLDQHAEVRPIGIKYYNLLEPMDVGIAAFEVPDEPKPGYYAVDVNYVAGSTFPGHKREPSGAGPYAYFQRFTPIAKAGYSIYIYHITPDEANRVRAEMGLPPWVEGSP